MCGRLIVYYYNYATYQYKVTFLHENIIFGLTVREEHDFISTSISLIYESIRFKYPAFEQLR